MSVEDCEIRTLRFENYFRLATFFFDRSREWEEEVDRCYFVRL